jgi:hypothetical protein
MVRFTCGCAALLLLLLLLDIVVMVLLPLLLLLRDMLTLLRLTLTGVALSAQQATLRTALQLPLRLALV